jgi:hypothetical protein
VPRRPRWSALKRRVLVRNVDPVASDDHPIGRDESTVLERTANHQLSVRKHDGTRMNGDVLGPSVDTREQHAIGFIIEVREVRETGRMAVHLQDRPTVVGGSGE